MFSDVVEVVVAEIYQPLILDVLLLLRGWWGCSGLKLLECEGGVPECAC